MIGDARRVRVLEVLAPTSPAAARARSASAFRYAVDATERPWMPTAMRAPFIMRNICWMPMCGWPPTRMPRQPPFSPKFSTAVAEALDAELVLDRAR